MGDDGKIITNRGWCLKIWLVADGRGWWQQNYGCLWVVVDGRTIY